MPPSNQAIPDETLRRVLEQIQMTLQTSSRQLSLVKAQKAGKEREKKSLQLTRSSVLEETKGEGARAYKGVGKMFVLESPQAISADLDRQVAGIDEEIANLSKKQKFLEKQIADAQGHMKDFFRGMQGAEADAAAKSGATASA